jgi:hypothetical protein
MLKSLAVRVMTVRPLFQMICWWFRNPIRINPSRTSRAAFSTLQQQPRHPPYVRTFAAFHDLTCQIVAFSTDYLLAMGLQAAPPSEVN